MSDGRVITETSVGRPQIELHDVERAAFERFGVRGAFVELGSQQDRNYRIDGGEQRLLLKVANPSWDPRALEAQSAAIAYLGEVGLHVPRVLDALDGSQIAWLETGGERLALRLLTYLPGTPLSEAGYLAPQVVRRLGELAGTLSRVLVDFDHDGLVGPRSGTSSTHERSSSASPCTSTTHRRAHASSGSRTTRRRGSRRCVRRSRPSRCTAT